MKDKRIKLLIILITVIFAVRIVTIFVADRLYSMSMAAEIGRISPEQGIGYLNIATKLDSTNADLYYQKYKILSVSTQTANRKPQTELLKRQLHMLRRCIQLCPSWPAYHMFYALTLNRMSPKPNVMTRELILSELKKAADLKPYSTRYHQIYQNNLNRYK